MRILAFHAENVQKLKVVDITPKDDVVYLTGPNAAGKTSALTAIRLALQGGPALEEIAQPLRQGTDKGVSKLTLGDGLPELLVTRTFTANGNSYLKVETPEGAKFGSPQAMLNKIIGKLTFDPLAFTNMKDKEQRDTLLKLVQIPIDLDLWAAERKQLFDERTNVNRKVSELESQIKGLPVVHPETPDEEVSAATILNEQREAQAVMGLNNDKRKLVLQRERNVDELRKKRDEVVNKIKELEDSLKHQKQLLQETAKTLEYERRDLDHITKEVQALQDPDLTVFEQRILDIEKTNQLVRSKRWKAELESQLQSHRKTSQNLTESLTQKDAAKVDALKSANMPIDGLSFDENGIFYNETPFNQCSSAERLQVSTAMGMALNPRLRIMFIQDGSLLDSKHRDVMAQMAKDNDYQLWIEMVDDSGKIGLYFEDGEIVSDSTLSEEKSIPPAQTDIEW